MMQASPLFNPYNYRKTNYYNSKNFPNAIPRNGYMPNNSNMHNIKQNVKNNYFFEEPKNFHTKNVGSNSSCFTENLKDSKIKDDDENRAYEQYFEIFGIKLFFDDLLILALLFFLYKEEVKDNYLYIVLFMLLLN